MRCPRRGGRLNASHLVSIGEECERGVELGEKERPPPPTLACAGGCAQRTSRSMAACSSSKLPRGSCRLCSIARLTTGSARATVIGGAAARIDSTSVRNAESWSGVACFVLAGRASAVTKGRASDAATSPSAVAARVPPPRPDRLAVRDTASKMCSAARWVVRTSLECCWSAAQAVAVPSACSSARNPYRARRE